MLVMSLIYPPKWARKSIITIDPRFALSEYQRVASKRTVLLAIVQDAIQAYINDTILTCETNKEGFPARDRLTGQYYIGSESFHCQELTPNTKKVNALQYNISIMARCLEKIWSPNQIDQDYLGLEVHLEWLPEKAQLAFYGDVDSSSI